MLFPVSPVSQFPRGRNHFTTLMRNTPARQPVENVGVFFLLSLALHLPHLESRAFCLHFPALVVLLRGKRGYFSVAHTHSHRGPRLFDPYVTSLIYYILIIVARRKNDGRSFGSMFWIPWKTYPWQQDGPFSVPVLLLPGILRHPAARGGKAKKTGILLALANGRRPHHGREENGKRFLFGGGRRLKLA